MATSLSRGYLVRLATRHIGNVISSQKKTQSQSRWYQAILWRDVSGYHMIIKIKTTLRSRLFVMWSTRGYSSHTVVFSTWLQRVPAIMVRILNVRMRQQPQTATIGGPLVANEGQGSPRSATGLPPVSPQCNPSFTPGGQPGGRFSYPPVCHQGLPLVAHRFCHW
jgi:hypothetical protein